MAQTGDTGAEGRAGLERSASRLGRVLTKSFSAIGEQVDNGALFAAFEEQKPPQISESEESESAGEPTPPPGEEAAEVTSQAHGEAEPAPAAEPAPSDAATKGPQVGAKAKVLKDKVSFVVGITNIGISCFWLGRSPQTFYIYYTIKCIFLFGLRFSQYRKQGLHYYFFDFCYLVNALLVLHCWIPPLRHNEWLWKAVFACCAGPLAWSIPALRNSLVLHDFDKTVSLFMHWAPATVAWTLRWYPPSDFPSFCTPGEECDDIVKSFLQLAVAPFSVYMMWSVAYYLKIFVISEKKIRERGYDTVYAYMLRKGGLKSLVKGYSAGMRPIIYLAAHCAACSLCFLVSGLFWFSFWAHTLLLAVVTFFAAWNGSCFYFDYFAFRYVPSMGLEHKVANKKKN